MKNNNIQNRKRKTTLYEKYFKRPLDLCCALLALVVLSPLMAVTAILVRVKLGTPVIFKQKRPGLNSKIFTLYKFRTMTDEKDEHGNLLPDKQRLTRFGKMLRSTSLDELPELVNILIGDMAVVGPRPLLVKYLPYYTKKELHRHDVRPGLTGLAQVNGRNLLSWDERLQIDCRYVEKITLMGDIVILFKTVKKVFCRSDITVGGNYVMKNFDEERMNRCKYID